MFTLYTLIIASVVAWILFSIATTIHSVYISPLSAVPGPKLAAACRIPLQIHKIRGDTDNWKHELHLIYGDVVRTGPNEVSFANGAVWKDIYGYAAGSNTARYAKDPTFYSAQSPDASLIISDDADHARQRKCFSPAFSEKALRPQESLIQRYVSQLIANIMRSTKSSSSEPINLVRQYNYTTFDIMGDLTFGEPLGCLSNGEYIPWIHMIFGTLRLATILMELNHYPSVRRVFRMMIPQSLKDKQKQHHRFSADRVDKRLANKTSRPDIWTMVLDDNNEDNGKLTRGEMNANAGIFMIAGTETTATLMSALTYYLLTNPDKMALLTKEIRGKFSSAEDIRAQDLMHLEYLNACIWEALRLHPPVPVGLPRVLPPGGGELNGYRLPEGTTVYVHHYSTYRNPRNFAYPDTFLPQRWLANDHKLKANTVTDTAAAIDPAQLAKDDKNCLQPFSVGPRNCIGLNLAWLEMRLAIAHVFWHFDLKLCKESQGWDDQKVFALWAPDPLLVTATPAAR